jgi:integrase
MRGSVVRRGKSWAVVIELPRDSQTEKRRQRWHSGFRTRKDAERKRIELLSSVDSGTYVENTRHTLTQFFDDWFPAIATTIRPATLYSYERNVGLHVVPYIGTLTLQKVDAGTLNALYARLLENGSKHRGRGLSARSVRYVHTILHRAFKDAVRWGRLARNPADAADPPRASASPRPEMMTWAAEDLRCFLEKIEDDRLFAAYLLLATTGMRRGEALGIRWGDIDLAAGRASVRQTVIAVAHHVQFGSPKTAKGRRVVSLDARTVATLRAHRQRQLKERMLMGAGWRDHDLVFAKPTGEPLHPERFSREFDRRVERHGLPKITLHGLRHTWATLALRAGVHPKVVQERLGHANVSITLDIYSHATPAMQEQAAERVATLVFGTVR